MPECVLTARSVRHPPFTAASDGQLGSEKEPSLGVLLANPMSNTRIVLFSVIPACSQSAWREEGAEHFMAQVELAAITTSVALGRASLRHRDVFWFVDTGAAVASVVRGKKQVRVHGHRGAEHSTHAYA